MQIYFATLCLYIIQDAKHVCRDDKLGRSSLGEKSLHKAIIIRSRYAVLLYHCTVAEHCLGHRSNEILQLDMAIFGHHLYRS